MNMPPDQSMPDLVNDPKTEYHKHKFSDLAIENEAIVSKEFHDCVFTRCSFRETSFRGCKFRDCTFKECDLTLVKVEDSSFQNTRFEASQVIGVNWAVASWPKITFIKPLEFHDCTLNYSTFIGLKLKGASIENCVAKDVDFSEADLTQANCRGTDFTQSRFTKADLTEADFAHAVNYQINANQTTLKRTKFSLPEAMALLYSLDIILTE